jgi:hypothetical protein
VIGETAEIGDGVLMYHGCTLGGDANHAGKHHPSVGSDRRREPRGTDRLRRLNRPNSSRTITFSWIWLVPRDRKWKTSENRRRSLSPTVRERSRSSGSDSCPRRSS